VFSQAPGQQSLDYAAWWGAEQPLQAPYRPLWEPLGVVATGVAPRFDERFRGWVLAPVPPVQRCARVKD